MVSPEVSLALKSYGMRYNKKRQRWESSDVYLRDKDIAELKLWEIDQILSGIRDGCSSVPLGPEYVFHIKAGS